MPNLRVSTPLRKPNDRGDILLAVIVAASIFALVSTMSLLAMRNVMDMKAQTERRETALDLASSYLARATGTTYANLGFFAEDIDGAVDVNGRPNASADNLGEVTLPLWKSPDGNVSANHPETCVEPANPPVDEEGNAVLSCPQKMVGERIKLNGQRPKGWKPFAPATTFTTLIGTEYRVDTFVTAEANNAKRVTVQVQWPASDGTCTLTGPDATSCVGVTTVRTADASASTGAHTADLKCAQGTAVLCETFVEQGRVLEGDSITNSLEQHALQDRDVLLYARTSIPVAGVKASWTWALNGVSETITIPASEFKAVNGDRTRWRATVKADTSADAAESKGWVRAGTTTVNFTATTTTGAQTPTVGHKATWSYASTQPVTVTQETPAACSTTGGAKATFTLKGLSRVEPARPVAQRIPDSVAVVFTTRASGGSTKIVTSEATLTSSHSDVYETENPGGGRVKRADHYGTYSVTLPPTTDCRSLTTVKQSIVVERIIDNTSTALEASLAKN